MVPADGGIARGVGKSSLIGDVMPDLAMGADGAARRMDTCGASSINVLRRAFSLRSSADASYFVAESVTCSIVAFQEISPVTAAFSYVFLGQSAQPSSGNECSNLRSTKPWAGKADRSKETMKIVGHAQQALRRRKRAEGNVSKRIPPLRRSGPYTDQHTQPCCCRPPARRASRLRNSVYEPSG